MITLIFVALVCLVVGAAAGSLLTRTLHPREKQRRELEEELNRAREEQAAYQQQVTEHFARTADLVSDLAHNFSAVHEQLASSAMHLATPEVSRKLNEAVARTALKSDSRGRTTVREILPEPPRDYAPKAPGGILSEDYGLELDTASRTAATKISSLGDNQKKPVAADGAKEDDEDPTLKVG